MANNITIEDIAKEAGVSITTVSRVLNNKPDVNSKTREKVNNIIDQLNYKPNNVARGLVLNKTYSIGLVIPDINNPFFPAIARGVEDIAKENSYSVLFSSTDNNIENEKKAIDVLLQKKVDGLILSLSTKNSDSLHALEKMNFPVVQLDRKVSESNYPAVMINNFQSAYKSTNYLIDKGFKKIAHITGNLDTFSGQQRKLGYIEAIKHFNYKVNNKYISEGNFSFDSGYKSMKQLLNMSEPPDSVFIANDMMALGAYKACNQRGVKIPEDVAIIGHDNITISELVNPPLTTVDQPKYKLGKIAFKKLLFQINRNNEKNNLDNDKYNSLDDVILSTKIIERESSRGI